jgi:hypothetical protein
MKCGILTDTKKFENELKRALSILAFNSKTQNNEQNVQNTHLYNLNKLVQNILILPDSDCKIDCVSKLSPFVSNRIEHTLIDYLNKTRPDKSVIWARYEGKFPDLQIVHSSNSLATGYGIEIKVVCAICDEPSARFWHATENFKNYECQFITILAWNLSNHISGYPQLVDSFSIDAKKLAEDRDIGIHQPPHRLVSQPNNINTKNGKNTKQTDIKVLIFQGNDKQMEIAEEIVSNNSGGKPWDQSQKMLTDTLLSKFQYR